MFTTVATSQKMASSHNCGMLITDRGGHEVYCILPLGHTGLCDYSKPIRRRLAADLGKLQTAEYYSAPLPCKATAKPGSLASSTAPKQQDLPSGERLLSDELAEIRREVKKVAMRSAAKRC